MKIYVKFNAPIYSVIILYLNSTDSSRSISGTNQQGIFEAHEIQKFLSWFTNFLPRIGIQGKSEKISFRKSLHFHQNQFGSFEIFFYYTKLPENQDYDFGSCKAQQWESYKQEFKISHIPLGSKKRPEGQSTMTQRVNSLSKYA